MAWLESAVPGARRDPSRTIFYSLDNEPDLWASTHARIRPTGKVTYAELVQRTEEYAALRLDMPASSATTVVLTR